MKKLFKFLTVVLITTKVFAQDIGDQLGGGIIYHINHTENGRIFHIVSLSDLHQEQFPEYDGQGFLFSYQDAYNICSNLGEGDQNWRPIYLDQYQQMSNVRDILILNNMFTDFSDEDNYWSEVFFENFQLYNIDGNNKLVYSFNDGHHELANPNNLYRVRCYKKIWDYEIFTSIGEDEQVAVIVEEEKHDDLKNPFMNPQEAKNKFNNFCYNEILRDVVLGDNNQEGYSYTSCHRIPIPTGCTDETAINFNAQATMDDSSCLYQRTIKVAGCTDVTATNYTAQATTDDGSCHYHRNFVPIEDLRLLEEQISGCTDSLACNFNGQATIKDDSCIYPIHSTSSVTACDSFTWQGQTVTSTQDLTYTYNDSSACGVHTLKVTINHPSSECDVCEEGVYVDHGAILDCHGNCAPQSWLGDESCDDGSFTSGGHSIYFNCEAFDYDAGDCCPEGEVADCHGNCAPETWLSDGYCDDGSYESRGEFIYFNCEAFNNDQGDCESIETTMMYNVEVSMHDSYGDGWNGNRYEIVNSWGIPVAQGELSSGSSSTDHWTLPADCYEMNVGGGTWQEEVSWHVVVSHPDVGTSIMQGAIGNAIGNFDVSVGLGDCTSDEWNAMMDWGRLEADASTQKEEVLELEDALELSAYYDAFIHLVSIEAENYGSQKLNYQLYDVLGHLIDENQLKGALTQFKISHLSKAIYMLKVNTAEKETLKTFKIVKN